jgi:YD repeat-containing protein
MTYNNLNQLQNKAVSSISNVSYTYDKTGNIKTITDNVDTQKSQAFIYDPLYRLINATGGYGTIGYSYDPIGNRLKEDIAPQPADESVSYQYNHNNQITKAIKNGITVGEYFYDGTGKRIKKIANGETTIFHYDIFGNIISETDANGTLKRDYIYLNVSRISMISSNSGTEQNYYYLNDHLGTPAMLTDNSGAVVWQGDYYPFGEIYQQTGTVTQPFRFPGQYYDSESGL